MDKLFLFILKNVLLSCILIKWGNKQEEIQYEYFQREFL